MTARIPDAIRLCALATLAAMGPALFALHPRDRGEPDGPASDPPSAGLIYAVQERLVLAGFDPGGIDGKLGPNTRRAIREFRVWAGFSGDDAPSEALLQDLERGP